MLGRRCRVLVGVLLALVLAGCSAREPAGTEAAAPDTDGGRFPVTVSTGQGEVTIPARPKRVVALGYGDVDTVVALGVTPVAVSKDFYSPDGIPAWLAGQLDPARTTVLDIAQGAPIERIAALRPDLIVATSALSLTDSYKRLSALAPTIMGLPPGEGDNMDRRTTLIGAALGREHAARTALEQTNRRIDQVPEANPRLRGKTYAYGYVRAVDDIGVVTAKNGFTGRLFSRWGMNVVPALADAPITPAGYTQISRERVGDLDGDLLVLGYVNDGLRGSLETSPLFQNLNVVRGGHYTPISQSVTVALQVPSVANVGWVLDQLQPFLSRSFG